MRLDGSTRLRHWAVRVIRSADLQHPGNHGLAHHPHRSKDGGPGCPRDGAHGRTEEACERFGLKLGEGRRR
ncbi:hypothetical protein L210DRAFT_3571148, partial [Boletus edulis BED1]